MANYCPIFLLSTFNKLLDKLIINEVFDYLERKAILNTVQHSFRRIHAQAN